MRLLPLLACLAAATQAQAHPLDTPVRIGVLTDMTGSLSAQAGPGAVTAAQMAAEDCLAAECAGMKIEILQADHQNKADVAVGIVRDLVRQQGHRRGRRHRAGDGADRRTARGGVA